MATCNVGATEPEEYGYYFAWGETKPKSNYYWDTYKLCNGKEYSLTKYNNSRNYGTIDNKTVLEAADDAATANWGGSWRMPTDVELTELCEQCTWTWTTQNGVKGFNVTSKSNGNSIFLPAAGYCFGTSFDYVGKQVFYWSRVPNMKDGVERNCAIGLVTNMWDKEGEWSYYYRCTGATVRPVCP